ncbi:MAG: hypothetical protein CBD16_01150 [Betaproteobacteria bacterium TMED156]|nr:MAG: hypothetical protein CBD16_01150 [Betaproteobacteria bacterium TMED156]|tara:strand:+ start:502 stop:1170 length:669 start_codon:yes stop_codon:yes gene_type:complete
MNCPKLNVPNYWVKACKDLSSKDIVMANLISNNKSKIKSHGDPFTTLVRAIIGQQISVKAAEGVWKKLHAQHKGKKHPDLLSSFMFVDPEKILKQKDNLYKIGISGKKAFYITNLAKYFKENKDFSKSLVKMSEQEITVTLLKFSGIGIWTINMFLIFCLLRPDIFPENDLGLIRAIKLHYDLKKNENQQMKILKLSHKWKPWRTVATWHLWSSIDPETIYY